MMNIKSVDQKTSKQDIFLWGLVVVLIAAGIGAYYYFHEVAWALRAAIGLVLTCVVVIIASQTTQGKQVWQFAKESRVELRKVVWPTRQETIQTTALVVAMVVVMALILWGVDSILMWFVGWLTGQRG
jgi:preprotein translocase subunit SecE